MIIHLICMFLLGGIFGCCICAMLIITNSENMLTDKDLDEMYEYYKKEYGDK